MPTNDQGAYQAKRKLSSAELSALLAELRRKFAGKAPRGYIPGKTQIRDAVRDELGCSTLRAEELTDELERRGLVRYQGDPAEVDHRNHGWEFVTDDGLAIVVETDS